MNKKRKSPLWMLVPMGVIIVVLSIVLIVITLKSGNQRTETASASHTQSGEKEEESVNAADTIQENPKETDTGPAQVYVSPDISREVYSRLKIADNSLIRFSAASSSFFLAAFLRLPPSSVRIQRKPMSSTLWAGSYIFPVISETRSIEGNAVKDPELRGSGCGGSVFLGGG